MGKMKDALKKAGLVPKDEKPPEAAFGLSENLIVAPESVPSAKSADPLPAGVLKRVALKDGRICTITTDGRKVITDAVQD